MKQVSAILMVLGLFLSANNCFAQDVNNRWAVDFGANSVDFYAPGSGSSIHNLIRAGYRGLVDFKHFNKFQNVSTALTRVHASRYLDNGVSVGFGLSINKIDHMQGLALSSNKSYLSLDADARYDLNNLIGETSFVDPYALGGLGYSWFDSNGFGSVNAGGGVNFWTNKAQTFGFNLQSMYKYSLSTDVAHHHFQHAFGIIFKFGASDMDKDGVYDKQDKCPDVAGLKEFEGCPDTDGDGISDNNDSCPNLAGSKALNGCPDADNDGIADKDDACPNLAGSKANNGCPDTDGDGVINTIDSCPNVAGPKANKGCPWPDSDNDGVLDKDDKCIDVAGPISNNGCPEEVLSAKAENQLNKFAKSIKFNSNRFNFKPGVISKLDAIVNLMKEYQNAKFSINGYTDSHGANALNLKLSKKRAAAVLKYLVKKGIDANRLSSKGFGEANPIDTNKTSKGRANNRRVEIVLVNKK